MDEEAGPTRSLCTPCSVKASPAHHSSGGIKDKSSNLTKCIDELEFVQRRCRTADPKQQERSGQQQRASTRMPGVMHKQKPTSWTFEPVMLSSKGKDAGMSSAASGKSAGPSMTSKAPLGKSIKIGGQQQALKLSVQSKASVLPKASMPSMTKSSSPKAASKPSWQQQQQQQHTQRAASWIAQLQLPSYECMLWQCKSKARKSVGKRPQQQRQPQHKRVSSSSWWISEMQLPSYECMLWQRSGRTSSWRSSGSKEVQQRQQQQQQRQRMLRKSSTSSVGWWITQMQLPNPECLKWTSHVHYNHSSHALKQAWVEACSSLPSFECMTWQRMGKKAALAWKPVSSSSSSSSASSLQMVRQLPSYDCISWQRSPKRATSGSSTKTQELRVWRSRKLNKPMSSAIKARMQAWAAQMRKSVQTWHPQLPGYECMTWQARTKHAERKIWKDCSWKSSVNDPYVYAFAFDTLRPANEPRWGVEKGTPLSPRSQQQRKQAGKQQRQQQQQEQQQRKQQQQQWPFHVTKAGQISINWLL